MMAKEDKLMLDRRKAWLIGLLRTMVAPANPAPQTAMTRDREYTYKQI
jgi:hypothetical protein